jgi:hypothetical protein
MVVDCENVESVVEEQWMLTANDNWNVSDRLRPEALVREVIESQFLLLANDNRNPSDDDEICF